MPGPDHYDPLWDDIDESEFGVRHYDMEGEPISMRQWTALFKDNLGRMIGSTTVGEVRVSTVWLGLDHRFGGDGPPIIFETMIFGGPHDQYQERYSTRQQAEEGHLEAVKLAFGLRDG